MEERRDFDKGTKGMKERKKDGEGWRYEEIIPCWISASFLH
jgi:hypothetical protein